MFDESKKLTHFQRITLKNLSKKQRRALIAEVLKNRLTLDEELRDPQLEVVRDFLIDVQREELRKTTDLYSGGRTDF